MPYSDYMPTVVFPNTNAGSIAWEKWDKSAITKRYFCSDFHQDRMTSNLLCDCRNQMGVKAHNLCMRCIAGYLYDPALWS